MRPQDAVFRFLDTVGDGSGTKNANGDYSVTPEAFFFQPARIAEITRIIIHISDTTGIQAQDYGNITGGLTNGYSILVTDENDNTLLDFTDGVVIKTNGAIGRNCFDDELRTWGAGDEFIQARWTWAKAGNPITVGPNHKVSVTLNDDCTGLLEHYFKLDGKYL